MLAETKLTPRLLDPSEFRLLLDYGIGLTDIVKDQAGVDPEIAFGDWGSRLARRLASHEPRYLCFNGKRAAREALGVKKVEYGPQGELFGATRLFVVPSTSAAARRWWDGGVWEELARLVRGGSSRQFGRR